MLKTTRSPDKLAPARITAVGQPLVETITVRKPQRRIIAIMRLIDLMVIV